MVVLRTTTFQNSCPQLSSHQKKCWLPGNIIKCLVYFVVPMNAAVHVMCFYYSSWNDKIYANIKISKVGKTWLSTCMPVYSFSVVRTADTGVADTRFLQPWQWMVFPQQQVYHMAVVTWTWTPWLKAQNSRWLKHVCPSPIGCLVWKANTHPTYVVVLG